MNDQQRWTLTDQGEPPHFLPRLQPLTFGRLLHGPFAGRVFMRVRGKPYMVASTRPAGGVSHHLVSDEQGHWLAFAHSHVTGRRQRTGSSKWWTHPAQTWGVRP